VPASTTTTVAETTTAAAPVYWYSDLEATYVGLQTINAGDSLSQVFVAQSGSAITDVLLNVFIPVGAPDNASFAVMITDDDGNIVDFIATSLTLASSVHDHSNTVNISGLDIELTGGASYWLTIVGLVGKLQWGATAETAGTNAPFPLPGGYISYEYVYSNGNSFSTGTTKYFRMQIIANTELVTTTPTTTTTTTTTTTVITTTTTVTTTTAPASGSWYSNLATLFTGAQTIMPGDELSQAFVTPSPNPVLTQVVLNVYTPVTSNVNSSFAVHIFDDDDNIVSVLAASVPMLATTKSQSNLVTLSGLNINSLTANTTYWMTVVGLSGKVRWGSSTDSTGTNAPSPVSNSFVSYEYIYNNGNSITTGNNLFYRMRID